MLPQNQNRHRQRSTPTLFPTPQHHLLPACSTTHRTLLRTTLQQVRLHQLMHLLSQLPLQLLP